MTRLHSDGGFGVRKSVPEADPTIWVIAALCLGALMAATAILIGTAI